MAAPPNEDAATSEWRQAFSGCTSILEALVKSTDDQGRASARAWWVVCMGSKLKQCQEPYAEWKAQAASSLPGQLTAQHTEQAIGLPGFEPLARCIINRGEAIGVDPAVTLDTVEQEGVRTMAATEWSRAVREVEPLRQRLQQGFLQKANEQGYLRRTLRRATASVKGSSTAGTGPVKLAAKATDMDIDELRVCQVWMYGLASRLGACQQAALEFANAAGMADPNVPLANYDQERWDPRSPPWKEMEACVHLQAGNAGVETDGAWRRPL